MKKATYLFFCLLALFIAGTYHSEAKQQIGIVWEVPETQEEAYSRLRSFEELGISIVEVQHPLADGLLPLLADSDINFLIRTGPDFATLSQVRSEITSLSDHFLGLSVTFRTSFNNTAIGLFSNSQVRHSDFEDVFSPVLDSLYSSSAKDFYFVEDKSWYYFHRPDIAFGSLIPSKKYSHASLHELDSRINGAQTNEEIIFLHSEWLLSAVEAYPELRSSLMNYKKTGEWLIPLPEVEERTFSANFPVLILFGLWMSLAVLLRLNPISRPMIIRYLLSHRFYADDILHYRERSAAAGLTLLIQHAVFSGLAFFILAKVVFSETGVQAFFHHLPALAIVGRNYHSFFVIGAFLAMVIPFISLLWLHFTTKSLHHFSQTINLYSGILFLDFILVTAMLTLFLAGTGSTLIVVLGVIFFFCWFAAFYIVSLDVSRFTGSGKFFYLFVTAGVFSLILIFITIFLINSTFLIEIIQLSASL